MRIAYIASGAAGMYCGTCLHDNSLAAALQRLGHDATLIPTYTPLRTDEADVSSGRIFYGAINVYLEQAPLFRRLPPFLTRWLDRPGLLRRVASRGAAVDPAGLGALTLSILRGEEGNQVRELRQLAAWLRDDLKPQVIHLNNSMFVGFARLLRQEVGVPVLSSVQGEDLFLDQLAEPHRSRVFATLRERARDVDAFVANSRYYADLMAGRLGVAPEKMHVVPLGLALAGHDGRAHSGETPYKVGYFARVCPEKGFGELVDAFRVLAAGFAPGEVRLEAAGYLGEKDRPFLEEQRRRLESWGLGGVFTYHGEQDREGKIRFLQSLDLLSVPTVYREPKGLFVLEALANGVPVVQPRHGAFPELIAATGGGILVEPGSPQALAAGIAGLLRDPVRRRELGERGREAVHSRFSDRQGAEGMLRVYERVLA